MQNHTGKFKQNYELWTRSCNNKTNYDGHVDKHACVRYQYDFCGKIFAKFEIETAIYIFMLMKFGGLSVMCGKGFKEKRVYERHFKVAHSDGDGQLLEDFVRKIIICCIKQTTFICCVTFCGIL